MLQKQFTRIGPIWQPGRCWITYLRRGSMKSIGGSCSSGTGKPSEARQDWRSPPPAGCPCPVEYAGSPPMVIALLSGRLLQGKRHSPRPCHVQATYFLAFLAGCAFPAAEQSEALQATGT